MMLLMLLLILLLLLLLILMFEQNGTNVKVWCKCLVVAVLKGDKVHVQWDADYLRPGESKISKEKLLKMKWNKHTEKGWRMDLDYQ